MIEQTTPKRSTNVLLAMRQALRVDFGYTEADIVSRSYAVSDKQVKEAWDAATWRMADMADIEQHGVVLLETLFIAGRPESPTICPENLSPDAIEALCRKADVYYYTASGWMVYPAPADAAETNATPEQEPAAPSAREWSLDQVVGCILKASASASVRAAAKDFGLTHLKLAMELVGDETEDCDSVSIIRKYVLKEGLMWVCDFIDSLQGVSGPYHPVLVQPVPLNIPVAASVQTCVISGSSGNTVVQYSGSNIHVQL